MEIDMKTKLLLLLILLYRRKLARERLSFQRLMACIFLRNHVTHCVLPRQPIPKILHYYEDIVPRMQPRYFRRRFRMFPKGLKSVTNYLSAIPLMKENGEKTRIPISKQVAMTMAYLGSKSTTISLGHLFGISEERFLTITESVMDVLVSNVHNIIKWPKKENYAYIARKFDNIGKHFFPNVIGAIDGCHLEIELTEEKINEESYTNYHSWCSMVLQATCTYDLSFIFVQAGWPGRANDAGIYNKCSLKQKLDKLLQVDGRDLGNSYHIVGDSAFPIQKSLMTPYKGLLGDNVDPVRSFYNKCLASKRQNIERAFSLLLRRFPRLYKLNQKNLRKKMKVILSACILHNICIWENDNIEYFLRTALHARTVPRRILDTSDFHELQSKKEGYAKRNIICARLYNDEY